MKHIYMILLSLIAFTSAFANNEASAAMNNVANVEVAATGFVCEDCLLDFGKESKVVIVNNNGQVIFYSENVETLDISNWQHGSYVAKINDHETIEFTL